MTRPHRGLEPITNGLDSEKNIFPQFSPGRTFPLQLLREQGIPASLPRLLLEAKQAMPTPGALCTEDFREIRANSSAFGREQHAGGRSRGWEAAIARLSSVRHSWFSFQRLQKAPALA